MLVDWLEKNKSTNCVQVGVGGVGRLVQPWGVSDAEWRELFWLSDYVVSSSVSARQVYLIPRVRKAEGGDNVGN
jgi:hypothetical protein